MKRMYIVLMLLVGCSSSAVKQEAKSPPTLDVRSSSAPEIPGEEIFIFHDKRNDQYSDYSTIPQSYEPNSRNGVESLGGILKKRRKETKKNKPKIEFKK